MKEKVSEWMDGEWRGGEADAPLAALRESGEARECWNVYHLIGDTLRGDAALKAGFAARFAQRLAQEPAVLAPGRLPLGAPQMRWAAMSAAAGVAAVALVGWLAFGPMLDQSAPVAKAPAKEEVAKAPATVPVPSNADDYLLAHQRYSPRGSLQGVVPYVRSVSEETVAGKR